MSTSPPVKFPNLYGITMSYHRCSFVAHNRSNEEVCSVRVVDCVFAPLIEGEMGERRTHHYRLCFFAISGSAIAASDATITASLPSPLPQSRRSHHHNRVTASTTASIKMQPRCCCCRHTQRISGIPLNSWYPYVHSHLSSSLFFSVTYMLLS